MTNSFTPPFHFIKPLPPAEHRSPCKNKSRMAPSSIEKQAAAAAAKKKNSKQTQGLTSGRFPRSLKIPICFGDQFRK
jgi:hypothetical protein